MRAPWLLLLLVGCPKVPDHLRVEVQDDQEAAVRSFTDTNEVIAALVGNDPMVRAPALPDPAVVEALDGGAPIAEWIREVQGLEQGVGAPSLILRQLAERHPESAVVPLARGALLRRAENRLGNLVRASEDSDLAVELAVLITPLRRVPAGDSLVRNPLFFFGTESFAANARAYGDRWVLTAWLSSPDLPTASVRQALRQPQYDGLAATPIGRLLADGPDGTADPAEGLRLLEDATFLSLTRAAADRDQEQADWAVLKQTRVEQLGPDPEAAQLRAALTASLDASAAPQGTGAAMVAATALRWLDDCADIPCKGVDRTAVFTTALAWGDEASALARVWQVIALKDAIDTMDAGHDTVLFPEAMLQLADALLGTGAGPLDLGALRRSRPDASVWLTIARATGADSATEWHAARTAIGSHLERITGQALELNANNRFTPLLTRILKRSQR